MTSANRNPFTNSNLSYPVDQRPDYVRFCRTDNSSSAGNSPFRRRVDMWMAAMCLAARRGLSPIDLSNQETVPFVEGRIFDGDPWRIEAIMMTALTIEKSIEVVSDAAQMMRIANGLAAAGAPVIVEMLTEDPDTPIWNLSRALEDELLKT